jgi:hypothetical protein
MTRRAQSREVFVLSPGAEHRALPTSRHTAAIAHVARAPCAAGREAKRKEYPYG